MGEYLGFCFRTARINRALDRMDAVYALRELAQAKERARARRAAHEKREAEEPFATFRREKEMVAAAGRAAYEQ